MISLFPTLSKRRVRQNHTLDAVQKERRVGGDVIALPSELKIRAPLFHKGRGNLHSTFPATEHIKTNCGYQDAAFDYVLSPSLDI